jgi:hemolysin III
MIGMVVLIVFSHKNAVSVISYIMYGIGMISLYSASAIHHGACVTGKKYQIFQKMDYAAIYLLIVGSYAPICLYSLPLKTGISMLAVQYALAAFGITATFMWKNAPTAVRLSLYLGMGWLLALLIKPLSGHWPLAGIALLVAEGLSYTIGTVVYATNKPNLWPGKFSAHDLWHIFVLLGSALHFAAVYKYVAMI